MLAGFGLKIILDLIIFHLNLHTSTNVHDVMILHCFFANPRENLYILFIYTLYNLYILIYLFREHMPFEKKQNEKFKNLKASLFRGYRILWMVNFQILLTLTFTDNYS